MQTGAPGPWLDAGDLGLAGRCRPCIRPPGHSDTNRANSTITGFRSILRHSLLKVSHTE